MGFFLKRYEKMVDGFEPITPTKRYLRINTLIADEKETIRALKGQEVLIKKTKLAHCYSYEAEFSLSTMTEHLCGWFYLQGLASQVPPVALNPQKDWTVIDMAAAPGSKTTQLAALMNNTGKIIALDKSRERLLVLRDSCERLDIDNVICIRKDARFSLDLGIKADAILLDAPCSGNYCSEENWEEKRTIEGIQQNARLQRDLLKTAHKLLKPGGIIIYSTCSLEPEENEMIINEALKNGFTIEDVELPALGQSPGITSFDGKEFDPTLAKTLRFWPHKSDTEGFFVAKLRKMPKKF